MYRKIIALGLPLLLTALATTGSGVIDVAMMGHYSTDDVAAVGGASAFFDLFSNVVLAATVGYQVVAAQAAGRDDPHGVSGSARFSLLYCGVIASLLTVVCCGCGSVLMDVVTPGQSHLAHIGARYLLARGPTLLLLVPFALLATTLNIYGRPLIATVAGVIVNVANLILDLLLIFGPGPAPRLGALGNGLATTLAWAIGVIVLLIASWRVLPVELRWRSDRPQDRTRPEARISWPVVVSAAVDYSSLIAFFAIVGSLGNTTLGGVRIGYELMLLLFAATASFGAALQILAGRAIGAGLNGDVSGIWRVGQRMLITAAVLAGAFFVVWPALSAGIMTSFTPLLHATEKAFRLVGVSLPLLAWSVANSAVLRARGLTKQDLLANVLPVLFIQLPLALTLTRVAHLGVTGAYLGLVAYWLARALSTQFLAHKSLFRSQPAVFQP